MSGGEERLSASNILAGLLKDLFSDLKKANMDGIEWMIDVNERLNYERELQSRILPAIRLRYCSTLGTVYTTVVSYQEQGTRNQDQYTIHTIHNTQALLLVL